MPLVPALSSWSLLGSSCAQLVGGRAVRGGRHGMQAAGAAGAAGPLWGSRAEQHPCSPQTTPFTTSTPSPTTRAPPWGDTTQPTARAPCPASGTPSTTPGEPGLGQVMLRAPTHPIPAAHSSPVPLSAASPPCPRATCAAAMPTCSSTSWPARPPACSQPCPPGDPPCHPQSRVGALGPPRARGRRRGDTPEAAAEGAGDSQIRARARTSQLRTEEGSP